MWGVGEKCADNFNIFCWVFQVFFAMTFYTLLWPIYILLLIVPMQFITVLTLHHFWLVSYSFFALVHTSFVTVTSLLLTVFLHLMTVLLFHYFTQFIFVILLLILFLHSGQLFLLIFFSFYSVFNSFYTKLLAVLIASI